MVRMFWRRQKDPVERVLRAARPEARDELVVQLMGRSAAFRPVRRLSRVAFAGAMTVFMVGFFASFGGLGYAASSAQDAATSVTRIAQPAKHAVPTRATQSAAQDQYGHQKFTPPVAKPKVKVKSAPSNNVVVVSASDELPFTGLGLGASGALGLMLLGLGALLRRREAHSQT